MRRRLTSKGRTSSGSSVPEDPVARELPAARVLTGSFWRQCSPKRGLVDLSDPAVTFGRYHRSGGPGVLYASSTETGAWAELFRHHEPGVVSPFQVRRLSGRVRVSDLKVLDLTDKQVRAGLGISEDELTADDLSRCQGITEQARAAGYDGVLAPSAALRGQKTLAIFASAANKITEENSHVRHAPARMHRFSARIRRRSRGIREVPRSSSRR
jgi:RES domain-containing protein